MIDSREALEVVVRHAVDLEDDYTDIAPIVSALKACGDISLVPRLLEVLDRFLDERNFYGRDLIATVLVDLRRCEASAPRNVDVLDAACPAFVSEPPG